MARWQKKWSELSEKSKRRLRKYAGAGPRDLKKMRAGMFFPKHDKSKIRFWNKLDNLIFEAAIKNNPDIVVRNSRCDPHAYREPGTRGYIGMPRDPVKWAALGEYWSEERLSKVSGLFKRNTLEHEYAELKLFRIRAKRTSYGKYMRTLKSICGKRSHHNGVHPLIAELNVSGRSRLGVQTVIRDWADQPGQNEVFSLLKQCGWTPSYGIPPFGRLANKIHKKVEKIFAPHFRTLIGTKIKHVERRYKGRALKRKKEEILDGATNYAGGTGLRRKYLK